MQGSFLSSASHPQGLIEVSQELSSRTQTVDRTTKVLLVLNDRAPFYAENTKGCQQPHSF